MILELANTQDSAAAPSLLGPKKKKKREKKREMIKARLKKCMTRWSKFHMTCRDWSE
jgi:hypothetical protein